MAISVKDANGTIVPVESPNANGRALAAASRPVVLSSEDKAVLDAQATSAKQDTIIAKLNSTLAVTQSGTWTLAATQSGAWNITNITGSISLPTGAATAANQATANTSLAAIDTKLGGTLAVTMTGASTATAQATGNASLAAIDTKLGNPLAVTGPATNAELRASALPVGGSFSSGGTLANLTAGTKSDVQLDIGGNMRALMLGRSSTVAEGGSVALYAQNRATNTFATDPMAVLNYNWSGSTVFSARGDANGTVVQSAISSATWGYAAAAGGIVNSAAPVEARIAAGANIRNYVKSGQVSFGEMGVDCEYVIRDGAAGTVLHRGICPAGVSGVHPLSFDPPLKSTANTSISVNLSVATTGAVYINLQGYTGA